MALPTIHTERICRGLFAAAGMVTFLGIGALVYGSEVSSASEFGRAGLWYVTHELKDNLLLWLVLLPTAAIIVALLGVTWRERAAFSAQLRSGALPAREKGAVSREQVQREAQERLEAALSASRGGVGTVVDALLGLPVDMDAEEVLLEPGQISADITLQMPMERFVVGSLPLPQYEEVLARLRSVLRIGEIGEGRLDLRSKDSVESMRLVLSPAVRGVKARLQVLSRAGYTLTLEELDLPATVLRAVVQALEGLKGVVLVVSPRGHGVSTMLYAMAHYLDRHLERPGLVASVERPVRRELPFLHQIEVGGGDPAPVIGSALKGPYRAVVVRYVDDEECMRIAFSGAEQRLVVACRTARSAAAAIRSAVAAVGLQRVRASLRLAIGQRVLRRLCPACRVEGALSSEQAEWVAKAGVRQVPSRASKGRGCEACSGSGYAGKLLVFEMLEAGPGLDRALTEDSDDAWRAAYAVGENRDLLGGGLEAVGLGRTSIAEVIAMTASESRSGER